jgi:endonuclease/exonuclease/phosphatase family metal-dependent hydrolase
MRLQLLIDEIVRTRPDVLVLQEVSTTRPERHCSVLRRLLAGVNAPLGREGISYNAAYGRANSDPTGLTEYWESGEAVLSRFEILAAEVHPFERQGTLGLENRIALRATLKGVEGDLDVVGVHLHHEGGEIAEAQVDEILERIISGRRIGNPVILAGDFNLEPRSRGIRQLVELGWIDAWARSAGGGSGYTFGHHRLEDPSSVGTERIDYIFSLGAHGKGE